ncbi:YhcN/YlaJ family sporulation lipoprotein [Bacillus sp. FJAT-45066]|uniref:YhcN/YlaJ family sporulation lipoprotein n=1 Tax=Bacillus sp. FJAT-45066 TaxID=2011010 RepID=UPI000BB8D0FD|nr:YhcN/YlaJ family sporulation lipoprotein [Bacillus sp. FJAT-45066]
MRKSLALLGLCGFTLLSTACQADMSPQERQVRHDNMLHGDSTLNVYDRNDLYNERNQNGSNANQYGFVREQKNPIPNHQGFDVRATMDYEEIANAISKMVVQIPHVQDVATLVTDEQVLIAYETNSDSRELTADQVSKSALSIVPRYYHVYVSDDPMMMKEIEGFGLLNTSSPNVESILEPTIRHMLKSPQGKKLNDGENANGEGLNELNEDTMHDEYGRREKQNR